MSEATSGSAGPSRRVGLVSAAWLLLGASLAALGPAVGVVRGYDGAAVGVATAAGWVVVLPAVLALAVSAWRPRPGLAVTAATGLVAVGRSFTDIGALTGPDTALRPELFYEATPRAHPFAVAGGGGLILFGDLVMVVAGVLAARRVAGGWAVSGDESPAEADDAMTAGGFGDDSTPLRDDRPARNSPMVALGLLGVLGLSAGALAVPYTGGFLDDRLLPPALSLWSLVGGLEMAAVAGSAVLLAATVPRGLALAALAGAGLAAAVPALTAVVVVGVGVPVSLGHGPWLSLVGAAVLVLSGLLAGRRRVESNLAEFEAPPPSGWLRSAPGIAAVLAGGFGLLAFRLPSLSVDGHRDTAQDSGLDTGFAFSASIPAPFGFAAIVLLIGGFLALIPASARAGRVVVALAWAPMIFALTQALVVYSEVASNLAGTADLPGITAHQWTLGPGVWTGIIGELMALVAAGLALAVARRAAQASTVIAVDEDFDSTRRRGGVVAAGLVVACLVVGCLPAFTTADRPGPSLASGYGVDSVGAWFLTLAMAGAAIAAGTSRRPDVVLAAGVGGCMVGAARLVIPEAVRAEAGFQQSAGFVAVLVLAALFLIAAAALAASVRTVTATDPAVDVPRSGAASRPAGGQSAGGKPAARTAYPGRANRGRPSSGSGRGRR